MRVHCTLHLTDEVGSKMSQCDRLPSASTQHCNTLVCHVGARLLPALGPQWLSLVSVSAISIHIAQAHPVELHARLEEVDLTILRSMITLQMSIRNGS